VGRNSDNRLIKEKLGWSPSTVLRDGLRPTYEWISAQLMRNSPKVHDKAPTSSITTIAAE